MARTESRRTTSIRNKRYLKVTINIGMRIIHRIWENKGLLKLCSLSRCEKSGLNTWVE